MVKISTPGIFLLIAFYPLFITAQTGRSVQEGKSTAIRYLSGTGKDDMVEWEFYCSDGRKSGEWTTIGVPSCWEQQGFGTYNYGHDPLENRATEYGLYRYSFPVPAEWKGKEVKIVFQGVMTDAEVKINGKPAGDVHQGAFYEFKYSITKLLRFGKENLLEVKVNKVSSNESVNYAERQADFWIFGGIYRPVFLQVFPKEHIERVAVDAKASGDIKADLFISAPSAGGVKLELKDLQGNTRQDIKVAELEKTPEKWSLRAKAENILPWNPEQPNLYQLAITLLDKKGGILHELNQRIGFRTVEVLEGDGIYVNGERIKFKGVDRHSFYPSSGRTTSKALSIEHVEMMKDMNMNAVRMSHYPPDVHFLDACDSLGLFVIDEVCTWHSPTLDTEVGKKIVKEAVVRDVNHPSILLWANGNETGWNRELDDDYAIWDIQGREVIHPWNIFRKTNTLHYMNYHGLVNDSYARDKILFPTEFLHGLYDGGHGAGLEDYWNIMWHNPLCAGGFLWDFADEAVVRTDKNGILDTDGNHAADGIVGPYGEKEASYYTIKEIWSPISIEDRFIRDDFNGIFRIENRYHFTGLSECSMTARWARFDPPAGGTGFSILSENEVMLPDLAPGSKGSFTIEKPDNWKTADALYLTARDPGGHEIFTWSYPVRKPEGLNLENLNHDGSGEISTEVMDGKFHVTTNTTRFIFSGKTSRLEEVTKGGRIIPLNNGPLVLGQNDKIDTVYLTTNGRTAQITAVFEESNKSPDWASRKEFSSDIIRWTIHPDGMLDLLVELKGKRRVTGYKGISFSFPESEVSGMRWLGDGPYRVWRNRTKGTRFGVWENEYNNTVTGESGYIYPEFKGFYSNLYWTRVNGRNNNGFSVYCHSPHVYLRMLTPDQPSNPGRGATVKEFPEGDISFVMNIPPIGTKFQEPELMGPHGNPVNFFGNDDDPIEIKLTFEF
jgi:hypothetical protein